MFVQADYIMDNITAILASQRATLADVANIRSYVTDMDRLPEFGRVRAARFRPALMSRRRKLRRRASQRRGSR
jgi:enamine deaminase RidA (YjgF/YER057c/UK114 family)